MATKNGNGAAAPASGAELQFIRAGDLEPWPGLNPRHRFDPVKLEELTESVRLRGVKQPLIVHDRGSAPFDVRSSAWIRYWIVGGERRWRAAFAIGPDTIIPCMVEEMDEATARELALVENMDRDDLTPIEEARGFRALEEVGWTQDRIAERFSVDQSTISNRIRLLQLPDDILDLVEDGTIAPSHARDHLLPFVNIPAKVRKQLYGAVIANVKRLVKDHPGAAVRGEEMFDFVQRTARGLSKPVSEKDGATPLFTTQQHNAECTCQAPRFKYTYGSATYRCFDEQWWERAQAAARRKRKKEQEAQKTGAKKTVATAKASGNTMDENTFRRKHGWNVKQVGSEPVDVSKLEGARFVVVTARGGKEKNVYCVDEKKYQAAADAAAKEIAEMTALLTTQALEEDAAVADTTPLSPAICAAFVRAALGSETLLNEFGIAYTWGNVDKIVAGLTDDELSRMMKIVAMRAQRGDYKGQRYVRNRYQGEAAKIIDKKHKPAAQALRRKVLAGKIDGESPAPAKKAAKKKPAGKTPRKAVGRGTPSFLQPHQPDAALAAIVGDKPQPRTEITKAIWAYVKKHNLQDPKVRRMINPDEKLRAVFGGKTQVSMFEMTKLINSHLSEALEAVPA